jgi:exopolyphosphatase/pppGpp-phosphohydrolase
MKPHAIPGVKLRAPHLHLGLERQQVFPPAPTNERIALEVDRQIELYRTRTADERRSIPGLQPKRAEVILAGACVVRTVLEKLGRDSLTVSDRGLRHGLLRERFGRV